jgi:hypothetical protein
MAGVVERVPGVRAAVRFDRLMRPTEAFNKAQIAGVLVAGLVVNGLALTGTPEPALLITVIVPFLWFGRVASGSRRIGHLPIHRVVAFRYATWPGIAFALATVALVVGAFFGRSWPTVFSSREAALGVAVGAFVWYLMLSTPLVLASTPGVSKHDRWLRFALRPRYWAAAALTAWVAEAAVRKVATGGWGLRPMILGLMAERAPGSPAALWIATALLSCLLYVLLRREFLRSEPAAFVGGAE